MNDLQKLSDSTDLWRNKPHADEHEKHLVMMAGFLTHSVTEDRSEGKLSNFMYQGVIDKFMAWRRDSVGKPGTFAFLQNLPQHLHT